MTDEYTIAKEVFLEVCDLEVPERSSRLANRCGENDRLREEVESLLEHYDHSRNGKT